MGRMIKAILREGAREQRGYVYILVLLFLVLGGLMIAPLLNFMGTGLESGHLVFEPKTGELYAADAGIDDAIWQIKYENISSSQSPVVGYDEYDYNTEWSYDLTDEVNEEEVAVTIKNEWIPKDISPLSPALAEGIIDAGKLRVNGSSTVASEYRIRIDYARQEDEVLTVQSIGIWLPSGFSYVGGSSNLESLGYSADVDPYAGGEAVIWSLGLEFGELPPADSTESAIIKFEYDYDLEIERRLETISWIKTSGVDDIPFSWDDDMKVFALTSSAAGGTTIESNIYLGARYSSLLNNAITSPGDVTLKPNTEVTGDVQYNGSLDNKGTINGEEITDEIDWPNEEEWRQFFLADPDLVGADDPGSTADIKHYYDGGFIAPWYCPDDLLIKNSKNNCDEPVKLNGTIYVDGTLTAAGPKDYILDLNFKTIFVDGDINFGSQKVSLAGSGCIIATGNITFKPQLATDVGFIFVCSLSGTVDFQPNGTFYGSVAGEIECEVGSGTGGTIIHTPPPGQLNLPGMGGSSTGGFGSSITKYTWKIE